MMLCILQMQDSMMQRAWGHEVTSLMLCGAQMSPRGDLMWFGPRLKMGICKDVPTRIVPHATSGRADFFGTFCNRCTNCLPGCCQLLSCAAAMAVTSSPGVCTFDPFLPSCISAYPIQVFAGAGVFPHQSCSGAISHPGHL